MTTVDKLPPIRIDRLLSALEPDPRYVRLVVGIAPFHGNEHAFGWLVIVIR